MADDSLEPLDLQHEETGIPGITWFRPLPKDADPQRISDRDLLNFGLRSRPAPGAPPFLKKIWLRSFEAAKNRMVPELVVRDDVRHGPIRGLSEKRRPDGSVIASGQNWCGIVLVDSQNRFKTPGTWIQAQWQIPSAIVPSQGQVGYASQWVGLDGYNSPDVLQAGFEADYNNGQAQPYAWIEWFTDPSVVINNMGVSRGDEVWVVVTSPQSNQQGQIEIANLTGAQYLTFGISPPAGKALVGNCIEWIMEKPGLTSGAPNQFAIESFVMQQCHAACSAIPNGGQLLTPENPGPTTPVNVTMTDANSSNIGTVTLLNSPTIPPFVISSGLGFLGNF